jgi:hypothetical protein
MRSHLRLIFRGGSALFSGVVFCLGLEKSATACELCAIYRATNARGESSSGFLLTLSEQFIHFGTLQREGEPYHAFPQLEQARLDTSLTHVVPTYNFSEQFGVSLNVPIIYRDFHRVQIVPGQGELEDERGTIFGAGDLSLIGRWTPLRISEMKYSIIGSVFGGVKFPTGNTERLDREVDQELALPPIFQQSHAHATGGIHQHDLTLGSGSIDGIFGAAITFRWDRWFFSSQGQYYLRTEGHSYQFGDEIMISGGPGAYILLNKASTLTLQANAGYDTMAQDTILGQRSTETGFTAWYFGPQLNFTWHDHFSANAGVDLPLRIYNHSFQTVPDYRIHGGLTWRF